MRIGVAGSTGTVGHHVVDAARRRGHEVRRLDRADGVDLISGDGVPEALAGVEAVVDVSNAHRMAAEPAREFFTTVAANLQRAAAAQGVQHVVTLSIVGADRSGFGYYRAKVAQERVTRAGPVPATIVHATQLHEFPAQLLAARPDDGPVRVFDMRVQPVAAAAVAAVLVEAAEQEPQGSAPDVAGPQIGGLVDLAREFVAHFELPVRVEADTETMSDAPAEAFLPSRGASIVGPSFAAWLLSPDAAAMA